jgi:hypothetical protein
LLISASPTKIAQLSITDAGRFHSVGNISTPTVVPSTGDEIYFGHGRRTGAEDIMDNITGLAVVILIFGMPTAGFAMYTFYRVRKLRTEERLAAIQRGVAVPMEPELPQSTHSRRYGILLIAGAIGYMLTFTILARVEPDAMEAAAFGAIPFTLGLGYLLDSVLTRRDARAS